MHYDDDELLDRLYGVGRTDDHLERCETCRARWERLLHVRRRVLEPRELPAARLAAERARIEERIANPPLAWWPGALRPAVGLSIVMLLALLVSRPAQPPAPVVASSDAQLLNEIYTLIEDDEPRAAIPVRALFEARQ